MCSAISLFDGIQLRRNPHRAPMIQEAIDNGYPVTEEMLWGKRLSADEIKQRKRALIDKMIRAYGFTRERAEGVLAKYESQ